MAKKTPPGDEPVILDCTVRDGNYAVDFKFTEADTALLVGQLARLGFPWIEVGHGLGLGASEAGKATTPADDCAMISAARAVSGDRLIGAFFIPGIARAEQLEPARDAGLGFVRIGANAPEAEQTYPYITQARRLGLVPCLNMMKSYGISPEEFAAKAQGAVDAGVEVVYCVDSAGGMMPERVAEYFDAARAVVDCPLGFHGHNNLMLAIPNCVEAYRHGARYLDASLCGLGRSAGNAPTEILVAVLERLGIATGIDLFELLDVVDRYMWPLVAQVRTHDAMGVAAGYSQLHSSYLPRVFTAARKHDAELRRLAARVAMHDPVELDEEHLEEAGKQLAGTARTGESQALVAFHAPSLSSERISSSMDAVTALVDGMIVSGAKRKGIRPVLHLIPTQEPEDGLLLPEFVTEDSRAVVGRVSYGSIDVLRQVVEHTRPDVALFLVSHTDGWAAGAFDAVREMAGANRTCSIRDAEIEVSFLIDVLERAVQTSGAESMLVYGHNLLLWQALQRGCRHQSLFVVGASELPEPIAPRAVLVGWEDWPDLNLQFRLVVCAAAPSGADAQMLSRAVRPDARVLSLESIPSQALRDVMGHRLIHVDLGRAYAGVVEKVLSADALFDPKPWKPTHAAA